MGLVGENLLGENLLVGHSDIAIQFECAHAGSEANRGNSVRKNLRIQWNLRKWPNG